MDAPPRPPLAKGLVATAKVLATLAGAGGVVGGLACGVGLVQDADATGLPTGPAFFGFSVLLAAAATGLLGLFVYALGLAADPTTPAVPRVLLGAGSALGALAFVLVPSFLMSDGPPPIPFRIVYPTLPLAALALVLTGLVIRAAMRRRGAS